ncbi:MAG: redoxin domain-containing protein [Gemmatimonadota bacterium]
MKVALAGSVVRIGVAVLVVAGGLWLLTFGSFEQEIRYSVAGGDPLPSFRLAALDDDLLLGDTTFIASSELKGRVVLLTFWATWCKPCDAEQPGLLALQSSSDIDRSVSPTSGVLSKRCWRTRRLPSGRGTAGRPAASNAASRSVPRRSRPPP